MSVEAIPDDAVPFTQYVRPHGKPRPVIVACSAEVAALAGRFIAAGGVFEAEVLRTNEVSLTAEREVDGETEVAAIEVVWNGPNVPAAVERLIRKAAASVGEATTGPGERTEP